MNGLDKLTVHEENAVYRAVLDSPSLDHSIFRVARFGFRKVRISNTIIAWESFSCFGSI